MIRRIQAALGGALDELRRAEQLYMILLAVLIGLLGGLAAVGFRGFIALVQTVAWRRGEYTVEYLAGLPWWWKLAAPAAGGLVVGLLVRYVAREVRGTGVPEVMEAVAVRGGRIWPRVVLAKLFASGISIGSGGSVGREGPIVQIASAMASTIGQWLRIEQRLLRTLVGCGAAAGIAGTFNAPVAGALFAVEVIIGDFGVAQFSPIVISSVAATVVGRSLLGDMPAFEVPAYSLVHASELLAYAGLGLLAGLAALLFIRTLYTIGDSFERIRAPLPVRAMLGGALVGTIGLWAPHVFGVGYETITEALRGRMVWELMATLVLIKVLAVSITIGSGGSGGIFAPSLFIGAMLGGAVGTVVHGFWPADTAGVGAYALVGMGAVVAGSTHAPITAILTIFELTGDYKIILPLMISCIIATLLTMRIRRPSIYTEKLLRRGVDIYRGRDVNVLAHVPVTEAMREAAGTVGPAAHLGSLVNQLLEHPGSTLFVTDQDGRLYGIIGVEEIRPLMRDPAALDSLIIAEDVMVEGEYPRVRTRDSLADVMRLMGDYRGEVPVLEDGRLAGVIWPQDVIKRYNAEVFKRDMAGNMAATVSQPGAVSRLTAAPGAVVAQIPVPTRFVGRTIRELDIRRNFNVSVLMIRHHDPEAGEELDAAPQPDYTFQEDDTLLVLGPSEEIPYLRRGVPRSPPSDE